MPQYLRLYFFFFFEKMLTFVIAKIGKHAFFEAVIGMPMEIKNDFSDRFLPSKKGNGLVANLHLNSSIYGLSRPHYKHGSPLRIKQSTNELHY